MIGASSIAAYCLAHVVDGFILASFKTHLVPDSFARFGPYEPLVSGATVLGVLWVIRLWMFRRRVFLKI